MQLYVKNKRTEKIIVSSIIAALYVALTYISNIFGLSYSGVQFRISEALTILPVFSPYAITGLTLGCFLSNLSSPFGIIDIILGTLSTFISAKLSRKFSKVTFKKIPILSPLPPVIIGAIVIGFILTFLVPEEFSFYTFMFFSISVGLGQFGVCYGLGIPLFFLIKKLKIFENTKF